MWAQWIKTAWRKWTVDSLAPLLRRGCSRHRRHQPVMADISLLEQRRLYSAVFGQFVDPNPSPTDHRFGDSVTVLPNGNVVVTAPYDDAGGDYAGAVYLYNGANGQLISAMRGSHTGDQVGAGGITILTNGNFVISSPQWNNNAGAVTWTHATTGISGTVSAANSFLGNTQSEIRYSVRTGVVPLSNGNYVFAGKRSNTTTQDEFFEFVTWGDGSGGSRGSINAANSLLLTGSSVPSEINSNVVALTNGNYVVTDAGWSPNGVGNYGAVRWCNGFGKTTGAVSSANSLVGSRELDFIGSDGIVPLPNGNYLVKSSSWDNGSTTDAGAVTWGNGATGTSGVVSVANSLVGTSTNDRVGKNRSSPAVTALSNGNYLIVSPDWDNGVAADAGAVTWGDGSRGVTGAITSENSLVGVNTDDRVGVFANDNSNRNSVTELTNGNFIIRSTYWHNGGIVNAGAVTWGNGRLGVTGIVSDQNSLVGTRSNDYVGGFGDIALLPNGNYAVASHVWDNGPAIDAGAVTWGNGRTGVSGVVTTDNSLVGTTTGDQVGEGGITVLSNGNFVIRSRFWSNGGSAKAGAVTWADWIAGIHGQVNASNSLVGRAANDSVGAAGVHALLNGNYVVLSPAWDNNGVPDVGAITWGSGVKGITGPVLPSNSLIGSHSYDSVGSRITLLKNGNYVVISSDWHNGAIQNAGAVSWGNGSAPTIGVVSAGNSLVGDKPFDQVGQIGVTSPTENGVTPLANGNYVVRSASWGNSGALQAGAITWGNGSAGTSGVVSSNNSLVGTHTNDGVGGTYVVTLTNGNYVVASSMWDNGIVGNVGALTLGDGSKPTIGAVSTANSIVGNTLDDRLGSGGIVALSSGSVAVRSPSWNNGTAIDAGAITWGGEGANFQGRIDASNSMVGMASNSNLQPILVNNTAQMFIGRFPGDNGGAVWYGLQNPGRTNVAPTIIGAVANQVVNDNAFIRPFANTSVVDADSQSMFARVTIVNGVNRGDFINAILDGWVRSVNGADITYTRSFSMSVNVGKIVETAMRAMIFQPRTNAILVGTDETTAFSILVNDQIASATNSENTVRTTSKNDTPQLMDTMQFQYVNDNNQIAPFSTVTVIDPDNQNMLARVTIFNGTVRGDFTPASTTGWTRTVSGNDIKYEHYYNPQANIGSVVQTALRAFVFQPRRNAIKPNKTELTDIAVLVSDGVANATAVTRLTTTSINNTTTIGGTSTTIAVNDNATVNPFPNLVVTDDDMQEMLISVTILNGINRGDFINANTGTGWSVRQVLGNNITYKRYFTAQANIGAAAQAAFRALVFQPRRNAINPGTTEMTDFQLTASDGVAPAVVNTSTRVTTTSVNDAPVVGGAVANQTMNDNQTKAVFSTITVTDPDTQAMNVIVTITNGVNRGNFTVASVAGWTRTVVGVDLRYNRYFNPTANIGATVQTAIRALIFQPRTNVPIGTTETTGITVFINDGLANTTNNTTSVITTGVAPRLGASTPAATPTFLDSDIITVILPSIRKPTQNPIIRLLRKPRLSSHGNYQSPTSVGQSP